MQLFHFNFINRLRALFPKSRAFLVGGTLRDLLLNVESRDYDIVITGIDHQKLAAFLSESGKIISVEGRAFGVIKFRPKGSDIIFDISKPRKEQYASGKRRKHAEVEIISDIREDLKRRDFTINAMALELGIVGEKSETKNLFGELLASGKLIDPFGGIEDIKNKIIRAVGVPKERFLEDPTRILRGIRFASAFNFTIEKDTLLAMKRMAPEILKKFKDDFGREVERVSYDMIGQEFLKSFTANPIKTIRLYDETGILKLLLPEVEAMKGVAQPPKFHAEGDVYVHTLMALEEIPEISPPESKLAVLFHDIGKPSTYEPASKTGDRIRFNNHDKVGAELTRRVLSRLRLPKKLIDDVVWLVQNHMRLPFSFPKMRKDKQKRFARDPLFEQLINVVCADAKASIFQDGKPNPCNFIKPVKKILAELKAEKEAGKPLEIINGNEIIEILKKKNPSFDPRIEGKTVGDIKKSINSLYDRGELKSKEEAKDLVSKWLDKR